MMRLKNCWIRSRVDHDKVPHSAAFSVGLQCLHRPVCPNTLGKYAVIVL